LARQKQGKSLKVRLMRVAAMRLRAMNYWLTGQAMLALLRILRRLPADRALDFVARVARRIGPLTGRHRAALDNLRKAFPEKDSAEIEAIALDMWSNMARLAAEYIFLDQLYDHDPAKPNAGRIEIVGEDHFRQMADENKPHIVFTGHLGNFELLPVAAASYGLTVTSLFRPPNNPYIADYIHSTRRSTSGELVASHRGVAFALAGILEAGGNIGLLVDQKFRNGLLTNFFGRKCQTNPMLAILARRFDCDVYPVRCIRLPGNRYRLEIEEKLTLARNKDGDVDVLATTQLLNDVVERWVREDPGQWMWFHRRWDQRGQKRNRARAGKAE